MITGCFPLFFDFYSSHDLGKNGKSFSFSPLFFPLSNPIAAME